MKIKQKTEDFRVRELLRPGVVRESGPWRVYRVSKRKLTSLQAAQVLAQLARAKAGDVSMAGLKDRQGVTVQYMALRGGREVDLHERSLRIESVGFAQRELDSSASEGNAFQVVVRGLSEGEVERVGHSAPVVRENGLIHYFDEQRFGNLRHGQGWVALELMLGNHEKALRSLLAGTSEADDQRHRAFKSALLQHWGDWTACREIAGKFQEHHSVFAHLKRHKDDFRGAFFHVAARVRLIHLYAFQSHLWNRAVHAYVERRTKPAERVVLESPEGPLAFPAQRFDLEADMQTFRLPGPRLADVVHPLQRELLADALAVHRLVPSQFTIEGVSGFQLKGEDRSLVVRPVGLDVQAAQPDGMNEGRAAMTLRFELPRGAYATLLVRRLLARRDAPARSAPRTGRPPLARSAPRQGDDAGRQASRPPQRRAYAPRGAAKRPPSRTRAKGKPA